MFRICLLVSAIGLLMISCKKETLTHVNVVAVEESDLYLLKSNYNIQTSGTKSLKNVLTPDWANTRYYPDNSVYLTPLDVKKTGTGQVWKSNQYLIFNGAYSKDIKIYTVLTRSTVMNTDASSLLLVENALLNNKDLIITQDRVLIKSKVEDYYFISNNITGNQVITKKNTAYPGNSHETENRNLPPAGCENGEPVCIDWYWQTYENGILIDEEYLYTTCDCVVTGGGGGNGNSGGVVSTQGTDIDHETNYVDQDIAIPTTAEKNRQIDRLVGNAVPIKYLHRYQMSSYSSNKAIISIIVNPVTLEQYVHFYQDNYLRQTTRRLTLLNHVQGYVLTSPVSANLSWFCSVNARYTYTNGNPTFTRQWDHAKLKVITSN